MHHCHFEKQVRNIVLSVGIEFEQILDENIKPTLPEHELLGEVDRVHRVFGEPSGGIHYAYIIL